MAVQHKLPNKRRTMTIDKHTRGLHLIRPVGVLPATLYLMKYASEIPLILLLMLSPPAMAAFVHPQSTSLSPYRYTLDETKLFKPSDTGVSRFMAPPRPNRVDGYYRYEDNDMDNEFEEPRVDLPRQRPAKWTEADIEDDTVSSPLAPMPSTRSTRNSNQRSRYKSDYDDDFDDDNNEYYDNEEDGEEEEDYDDTDQEQESSFSMGNFWFNSNANVDAPPSSPQRRRGQPRRRMPPKSSSLSRPRRPTTFRSGTPPPPAPVSEFYDRLFWYGLDRNEGGNSQENNNRRADATMFGGTKGKFNGLGFLGDLESDQRRPRYARRSPDNDLDDEYDDNDYEYSDDDEGSEDPYLNRSRNRRSRTQAPPPMLEFDEEQRFPGSPKATNRRKRRERPGDDRNRRRNQRLRDNTNDRAGVSSWFEADDDDENDDEFVGRSRGRNQRGSFEQEFFAGPPPLLNNLMDSFFGMSRDQRNQQAKMYNQRMRGITYEKDDDDMDWEDRNDYKPPRRKRRRSESTPRRSGYAYKYYSEDDNDDNNIDDVEVVADYELVPENSIDVESGRGDNGSTVRSKKDTLSSLESQPSAPQPLSWEERSLALERVPPGDVPAWGPSGVLMGVDARTQAIQDALHDLLEARRLVESRNQAVEHERQELAVLRVDQELAQSRYGRRIKGEPVTTKVREYLLSLQEDVEEAAREYRLSVQLRNVAQEALYDLERRHWAVLQFYNPTQAEALVDETLQEIRDLYVVAQSTQREENDSSTVDATAFRSPTKPVDNQGSKSGSVPNK